MKYFKITKDNYEYSVVIEYHYFTKREAPENLDEFSNLCTKD